MICHPRSKVATMDYLKLYFDEDVELHENYRYLDNLSDNQENIIQIEAHVCICFVAYKVYKELERLLKINNISMSVDKVLDIAKTITTVEGRTCVFALRFLEHR